MGVHAVQVRNGEPQKYWLRKSGKAVIGTVCCDCSLVHDMIFTPRKRYILVKAWRDDNLTKALRKQTRKRRYNET